MSAALIEDDLDAMFAALADRTRRSIVVQLTSGDATVNELAAPFAMSVQAVSRHIQVLERAGLISRGKHRQTRPCHLEVDRLAAATAWLDQQRALWSDRFDQLDEHLVNLKQQQRKQP